MEHRDILRLVETSSQGLPPYFKEQIRTDGPDAGRANHLYPSIHLLPRRTSGACFRQTTQRNLYQNP